MIFELPADTPKPIKRLPRDERGFPIPFFSARMPDGTRDITIADERKRGICLNRRICWVCGQPLNIVLTVLGGPMTAFNRYASDMPCHPNCAEFSAKYCPHLNYSNAKRRKNKFEDLVEANVGSINEHPGVIALIYCLDVSVEDFQHTFLIRPEQVQRIDWWFEGEKITADQAAQNWKVPQELQEAAPDMVDAVQNFIIKTGSGNG